LGRYNDTTSFQDKIPPAGIGSLLSIDFERTHATFFIHSSSFILDFKQPAEETSSGSFIDVEPGLDSGGMNYALVPQLNPS